MTHTTEQVRGAFIRDQRGAGFYTGTQAAEFDAWLAEHDAEVRQQGDYFEGLQEGFDAVATTVANLEAWLIGARSSGQLPESWSEYLGEQFDKLAGSKRESKRPE